MKLVVVVKGADKLKKVSELKNKREFAYNSIGFRKTKEGVITDGNKVTEFTLKD